MSVTPITIDGSAGGTIYDQAGEVVIQLGAAAATVVAGLGTDTIVGAEGSILVNATEDANPLLVQPGVGTASVFAGAGTLSVLSADGSQIIDFTGPPDHFYLVTTDGLTVVTTVSDGSGTDTIMGGSLTYTQAGTMWTPPTLPGGGGTDTTGGGGTDTTGGGGTDTTGGGVPGVPDPFGGLGGSGLYTTLETTFTTLLGDGWNNGGANFVVFGPGDTPPVTQPAERVNETETSGIGI